MEQKFLGAEFDIDDILTEMLSALGDSYGCDSTEECLACQSLLIEWGFDPESVVGYFEDLGW